MEHAFSVMLRAELTSASPNKLSALTQSAVKLRPNVVARVLSNHVRQVRLVFEANRVLKGLWTHSRLSKSYPRPCNLPKVCVETQASLSKTSSNLNSLRCDRHH